MFKIECEPTDIELKTAVNTVSSRVTGQNGERMTIHRQVQLTRKETQKVLVGQEVLRVDVYDISFFNVF